MHTLNIFKPTWQWGYCSQSGWSFQIGNPHLALSWRKNKYANDPPRIKSTRVKGEMAVHVFYAQWMISGSDYVSCSSTDDHEQIVMRLARMDGIDVLEVDMNDGGLIDEMRFQHGIVVKCIPYEDSDFQQIANLIYHDPEQEDTKDTPLGGPEPIDPSEAE